MAVVFCGHVFCSYVHWMFTAMGVCIVGWTGNNIIAFTGAETVENRSYYAFYEEKRVILMFQTTCHRTFFRALSSVSAERLQSNVSSASRNSSGVLGPIVWRQHQLYKYSDTFGCNWACPSTRAFKHSVASTMCSSARKRYHPHPKPIRCVSMFIHKTPRPSTRRAPTTFRAIVISASQVGKGIRIQNFILKIYRGWFERIYIVSQTARIDKAYREVIHYKENDLEVNK